MDERHKYRFAFSSESRGKLLYQYYFERIDGSGANVYGWNALLPFDQKLASTYVADVIVDEQNLIVIPNDAFFTSDTLIAAYRIEQDKMLFAFVNNRGEMPEQWGMDYGQLRPTLTDLLATW